MKLDSEVIFEAFILFILWLGFQITFARFMRRVK